MKDIIIYGSSHDSAKDYAMGLGQELSLTPVSYKKVKDISSYERIIFVGSMYGGGVKGLKETMGLFSENHKIVLVTVGIADVKNTVDDEAINNRLKKIIPDNIFSNTKVFNLNGKLDYSSLGARHKAKIWAMGSMIRSKPKSHINEEDRVFLDNFDSEQEYDSLELILKEIRG